MKSQHPSFTLAESDEAYFAEVPRAWLKLLKLLHHEKMNYVEIAQQVGLPRGTVATRIFKARNIIKQMRAADEAAREMFQAPTMPAAYEVRA
jgi:DNA-directed RNA polymerase specialized sigma24 family protein